MEKITEAFKNKLVIVYTDSMSFLTKSGIEKSLVGYLTDVTDEGVFLKHNDGNESYSSFHYHHKITSIVELTLKDISDIKRESQ
jgi:hypothetical protein